MIRQQSNHEFDSPTKGITDEEINQCMEFCAMYNILYAMHKFPLPLKNIDEKKKVKTSKLQKPVQTTKTEGKKGSKFQKPKTVKKQQKYQLVSQNHYEASQVENYAYQSQEMQDSRINFQKEKSQKLTTKSKEESPGRQIDLAALISGMEVGSALNNRNNDNGYSLFRKDQEMDYKQSRLYQQESPFTSKNNQYQKYDSQNSSRNYYANEDLGYKSNQSQYSPSNPYDKAGYQSPYDLNNFMANPMQKYPSQSTIMQSPFAAQLRTFNNPTPYDTSQNITRTLFNQLSNKQLYQPYNQPYSQSYNLPFNHQSLNQQFNQPFDPFNYERKDPVYNQHSSKNKKYINIANQQNQQYKTYSSNIYQSPGISTHIKSAQKQQNYERTHVSSFVTPSTNPIQSQYPVQNTPPKTLNSSSTQRSLSPLGSSASCRNFFVQTPKQVSVDRNGVSRSKSRRKEKPGGSKSFYQPSLSGRKVVSKQRDEERDESTYSRPRDYLEQDLHMINKPSEINENNREEDQETREIKKKPVAPTQYPRNTRETEFSGVSGWQPESQPQKSTKSQQVINNRNLEGVKSSNNQFQKRREKESPRLGYEKSNHYQYDEQSQDNDVGLEDLEEDMEKLNASRRKAPKPITEVDLTDTQNPKVRQKK